jgi:NADH-quinone oxidoreductase subunit F
MEKEHRIVPAEPYASYAHYRSARGGAIDKARAMAPNAVIDEVRRAGLRGRGGAGFPTAAKWAAVQRHPCPTRYVVCNAAEGEPGTFKDRHLLRRNPYSPIEGMLIAAYAIGARAGYIAIKASFKKEIARLCAAVEEMTAAGALGDFDLEVVEGPEEYLFGEEKALLNVIEGDGPLPRGADERPHEIGLFATATSPNPALVNNVETFAHVPAILSAGAESFRRLGTRDLPGTLLCTLSGDLTRPGVYELPAGVSLRHLLYEVGGGPKDGRSFKAVLSGLSAGLLLPNQLDTRVEFGALALAGSGLGSAGFIVYDDRTNMARVAQMVARFLYVESCNQCSACKVGLRIASTSLDGLFRGADSPRGLVERALIGALHAPQGNRCYLPVQAATLVQSLVHHFGTELWREQSAEEPIAVVPKIVDFDEATGTFLYDEMQALKQPDWTYLQPAIASAPASRTAPAPA